MSKNYYDILGIDKTADTKTIRRAYLKLSLQYHPDKNPDDIETAKSKFIEIGQAHDTLIDPTKRALYDHELRTGNNSTDKHHTYTNDTNNKSYHKYRDRFDSFVGEMSESDLQSLIGKVSAVAGMVGGVVGSVMMNNSANSNTSGNATRGIMGQAGSLMGSMVASDMASSTVRTLHRRSLERIAYKKECQRALERGEPMPIAPESAGDTDWKAIFQQVKEGMGSNQKSDGDQDQQDQQQGTSSKLGNLWNKAAPAVKAAMAAHAVHATGSNASKNSGGSNDHTNRDSFASGVGDLWKQAEPFVKMAQDHLGSSGGTNNNGNAYK